MPDTDELTRLMQNLVEEISFVGECLTATNTEIRKIREFLESKDEV